MTIPTSPRLRGIGRDSRVRLALSTCKTLRAREAARFRARENCPARRTAEPWSDLLRREVPPIRRSVALAVMAHVRGLRPPMGLSQGGGAAYVVVMAVVARIFIESADHNDHDRLGAAVESRIQDMGGPPDGLMIHVGYPHQEGFVIVEGWRTEELFRQYMDDLLGPALADAALAAADPEIAPAWSIARP